MKKNIEQVKQLSEKEAAIALLRLSGIGPIRFQRLLKRAGSAKDIWLKAENQIFQDILQPELIKKILNGPDLDFLEEFSSTLAEQSIWVLFYNDDEYPEALKKIYNPPPIIFGKGNKEVLQNKCIAIVGSRKATNYGLKLAKAFAKGLVEAGFTIVSGLALGIDSAAHFGALEADGVTIGVKGCGVDVLYPFRNRSLLKKMEQKGAIISEFFPKVPPEPGNFPSRNRIISGLSKAVVVIEAGKRSGSKITAQLAAEQGREVMAVPGSVYSQNSKGCHELIRQGATLVESVEDVLEVLGYEDLNSSDKEMSPFALPLNAEMHRVINVLEAEPQHIDEIAHKCHMPVSKACAILLELELIDIAMAHGAGRYSLIKTM